MSAINKCLKKIKRNLQYIERDGGEFLYTLQAYPDWLQKKITLLKYFRDYMSQHLLKVRLHFFSKTISENFSFNFKYFRPEPQSHHVQVMKCLDYLF